MAPNRKNTSNTVWQKTCFKKVLAGYLLNTCQGQTKLGPLSSQGQDFTDRCDDMSSNRKKLLYIVMQNEEPIKISF